MYKTRYTLIRLIYAVRRHKDDPCVKDLHNVIAFNDLNLQRIAYAINADTRRNRISLWTAKKKSQQLSTTSQLYSRDCISTRLPSSGSRGAAFAIIAPRIIIWIDWPREEFKKSIREATLTLNILSPSHVYKAVFRRSFIRNDRS